MLVLGQCCNGIAVSITMIIPPAVADVWFPVHERTTATAISSLAAVLGAAGAFIVGPLVVSMPTMNGSDVLLNETNADMIKSQVKHYDLVNFWLSLTICLLCIVYLPAKPKSAPSVSAQSHRYSFGEGLKNLLRKPAIWLIAVTFAIPNGFFGNWLAMLYPILNTRVTQKQAGWMSFSGSMGGVVVGLIAARVVDRFKYAMKPIIIVIGVLAAALFIVFTLMSENVIHVSIEWFYVVVILANSIVSSNLPLFLDITVEISNPIAEGVTSGFLILAMTLGAALALGLSQIRVLGTRWMNWCVCGGYGLAPILLLMFLKVRYLKVEQDKEVTVDCSEKDKETLNKQVEKDKANIG